MRFNRTQVLLIVLGTLVPWSPSVFGGEKPPTSNPTANPDIDALLIDLDFPGGTLGAFLDALRAVSGELNILGNSPEAMTEVKLPPIRLRSVPVDPALRVIEGDYRIDDHSMHEIRIDVIDRVDNYGDKIYRIRHERRGRHGDPQVKVWSVADLIQAGMSAEDVLTAVESAVGLVAKKDTDSKIRFHESTSLMLATGSLDEVSAIGQVIAQLRESRHQAQDATDVAAGAEAIGGLFDWIYEMKRLDTAAKGSAGRPESASPSGGDDTSDRSGGDSAEDGTRRAGVRHDQAERLVELFQRLQEQIHRQDEKIRKLESKLADPGKK